jgi:CRISPR-associated exonuclease Cas4
MEITIRTDEDLLALSALQHFIFCQRQCALIHIEQLWEENLFTAQGRLMHDKVHDDGFETRAGVRIERSVALRSLNIGLVGVADVVEFHKKTGGGWQPFPVEHKRGKPKPDDCDKVQLCAQALCLEEMLNTEVPAGALFYGKTRRRLDVMFDPILRAETQETAQRLHRFVAAGKTPAAVYEKKCESCSLKEVCLPRMAGRVNNYIQTAIVMGD